jgi:hypothetical protein
LTIAQEENPSQLEERARRQEEHLKKTLQENERLLRKREQQEVKIRTKQETAVEREHRNLQQVGSMEKLRERPKR